MKQLMKQVANSFIFTEISENFQSGSLPTINFSYYMNVSLLLQPGAIGTPDCKRDLIQRLVKLFITATILSDRICTNPQGVTTLATD